MLGAVVPAANGAYRGAAKPHGALADTASAIRTFHADGTDWPTYGGDYSEQRFSPLTQINKRNVSKLGFAWEGDLEADRGLEATPIVVDGIMYVTSTWSRVFAFDAATGRRLWMYDPQADRGVAPTLCCDIVNRGVAVWNGRVYVGTLDGRLVALDGRTGKVAWSVDTVTDHKWPYSISGAPLVVNGKVVIGNSGGDRGVRAYVTAYDAATGKQQWRFFVVPKGPKGPFEDADQEAAAKTWPDNPVWTDIGGGSVWGEMTYDPALDLLYFGTGNAGPWKRAVPDDHSDTLYTTSVVALHADTGRIAWHYQQVPNDRWDYDSDSPLIMTDLPIGGRQRQVLLHAPKNGFFYVLDRATGELLSAEKYGPATWATHIDLKTGRPAFTEQSDFTKGRKLLYPWPNGDHDWQPISFNPHTGLTYLASTDVPWVFDPAPGFHHFYDTGFTPEELGQLRVGQPIYEHGGFLRAWDARTQKLKWQVKLSTGWNGGTLSTAADLVFHPSEDGYLSAYDAATGKRLAHIFTGSSAMPGPVTYTVNGVQYVAIVAGYGGAGMLTVSDKAAVKVYENKGRVIVLRLGGGAVPIPPKRPHPLGPPVVDNRGVPPIDAKQAALGHDTYMRCAGCHGTGGSTPILPNLSRVREIGKDGFRAILLEGALSAYGMPNFNGKLTDEQVNALYEYVSRGLHNKPNKSVFY